MSSPGTLRFGQVATTPSPPPSGYDLIYVKTDDVLYIQDSAGVEVALGSASAITSLTGEVTATGPGAAVATVSNSAVIGKILTGFTPGPNSTVLATDTILQAFQKLQAQVSATVSGAITSLTGDVTATGPGAAAATVVTVGGATASDIAQSVSDTQAATALNTASTIVKRNASGNFAANVITASLSGNATTSTTSTNFTGSLSGDVTGTQSATVVALVGGATAANVATSVADTQAATSVNTPNTIVKRDGSGNFAAGTITANLTGTATNATTAVNFSGSLLGDVTGTQTTTSISSTTVTGKLLTGYTVGSNTPLSATDSILLAFEKVQGQLNATTATAITSLTGDVTATGPGAAAATVVSVGGKSASAVAQSVTDTQAATSSNTPNTIVKRDGSGNFSAGTITANLTGNVSGTASNVTGIVAIANGGTNSSTALNNNRIIVSSGGSIVEAVAITANRALASNASGIPVASVTTDTELAFVSGVTSSIQTQLNGKQATGNYITALTGDATATGPGSVPITLATVNGNVGTFGSSTSIPTFTVNAKGLITAASGNAVIAPAGTLTGTTLASNVVSSSLTSVGTITSGTWNGTAIDIAHGGTNNTTAYTAGSVIFSDGTKLTQDNANFYWDDTQHSLGIGVVPTTNTFFDIVTSLATATQVGQITGYGNANSSGIRMRRARGTSASPTAVQSGDNLGFVGARGYGASQFAASNTSSIIFQAIENFTNTANGTSIIMNATPTGSVTLAEAMRVASTGVTLGPQSSSTAIHQVNGGIYYTTRTITANLTLDTTTTDYLILCNQSGAISITLPTPVVGRVFVIKDISGTAQTNNITLVRHSTEKIEGLAASKILETNWGSWTIGTNGTDWYML